MTIFRNSPRAARRFCACSASAFLLLAGGCASYSYTRPTAMGPETTTVQMFLVRGNASKISVTTKDGAYSRSLRVGMVEGESEADKLNALVEAAVKGAVSGAVKP